ncbi:DUF1294 domain-containing protein [Neisseria sp. ZJ106]|uniref:DUF1294 domain-containing protein n=1 Tax=Neisseria lisongii TaxID=2912188 RepID=A0ABY7RIS4_9NEIS|nr:DUF1294 domain-containing protein [Neisseria lisongii]MCF7520522.1 DUF1294 domain-containing protein [Neisseria lisongii]WCL71539.1 DUF1294 domain-containing protein [Neisseria lisongii]
MKSAALLGSAAYLAAVCHLNSPLGCLYLILSAVGLLLYGFDKHQARRNGRRIPEKYLHLTALFGGWSGAWLGRHFFRHKTAKTRFTAVFRLTVAVNIAITIALLIYSSEFLPIPKD